MSQCFPLARVLQCVLAVAAVVLIAALPGDKTAQATTFAPVGSATLADHTPGANSDVTIEFNINAPDSQFGAVVAFTPANFAAETATSAPIGAYAARLVSTPTLGLINGPCNISGTPFTFDMMIASTDINDVLGTADAPAYGRTSGRNPGPADDQFDIVNDLPLGVTKYPDYLKRILVDGAGNPLEPTVRLYGQTIVSGTDVSLGFAQFEPGTQIHGLQIDPALGTPSVTVLLNTGDPGAELSPIPITDFCAPLLASTTIFGVSKDNPQTSANEAGTKLSANPAGGGVFNFMTFAASMPDADDDGIENFLDTCPTEGNPDNFDPRAMDNPDSPATGDPDADGIPNACDPTPNSNLPVNDADEDGYANRGDNCPTVPNGLDPGGDGLFGTDDDQVVGEDNQKDTDTDLIGDACDPNPTTRDGHIHTVCNVSAVTVGAGGNPPPSPNVCTENAVGIDANGNGVFDSLETSGGNTTGQGTNQSSDSGGTSGTTGQAARGGTTPGAVGGPASGIGTLSPTASRVPAWAAIATGLGGAGLLGTLSALVSRRLRRRH